MLRGGRGDEATKHERYCEIPYDTSSPPRLRRPTVHAPAVRTSPALLEQDLSTLKRTEVAGFNGKSANLMLIMSTVACTTWSGALRGDRRASHLDTRRPGGEKQASVVNRFRRIEASTVAICLLGVTSQLAHAAPLNEPTSVDPVAEERFHPIGPPLTNLLVIAKRGLNKPEHVADALIPLLSPDALAFNGACVSLARRTLDA